MKDELVILDGRETLLQSVLMDSFTGAFQLLCIYCSLGSTFWTFVSGTLFILFVFGRACSLASTRRHVFHTVAELKAWADDL